MLAFLSFDVSAGEIRGILRDHGGAAMPSGWRVMAHGVDHGGGAMALTDDSGSFSLIGLPEGRTAVLFYPPYAGEAVLDPKAGRMIRVSAAGVAEMELWLDPRETAVSTFDFTYYHGEFYDNKATAETATPVLLPDHGSVTVDMELSPGGGSISGRVTREVDGSSVAGIIVWAGSDSAFSFDRTDEDGSYRITGLAAGSNIVVAGVLFGPTQSDVVGEHYLNNSEWMPTPVEVSQGADTHIDFELAQAGSISGRVTSEVDGLGVPDMLIELQHNTLNNNAILVFGRTDASGFYQVGGLIPGSWWVGARGGNWLPENWNNHPHDGRDPDFVLVTAGENTSNPRTSAIQIGVGI
ncbi:MAG: carboxypeptidase-like regulatory domain-containing protein [Candidatus Eisenbacteria bacterium]|nr:carboxypeptidase-like regulatory domain-containing protein [Candidatus Eisenbacteria bacterium]